MLIASKNKYEFWEASNGEFCIIIDKVLNKRYIYKTYCEAMRQFIEWTNKD